MTGALERARADLDAGRAWQARDRLTGLLTHRQDDEVLELLARVHLEMGELPKAGALLHVLNAGSIAPSPEQQAALNAWRRRFGDPEARWRSIPAPVRVARAAELDLLRAAGPDRESADRDLPAPHAPDPRGAVAFTGCLLVLLVAVALAVVGAVTVVGWLL